MPVIHVVAALVVDARGRMCLVRKRGTDAYMQPGGKPEPGESALQALVRELAEELALEVAADDLVPLGRFTAEAANEPGHTVVADVFRHITGADPQPHAEIAEVRWADPAQALAMGPRLAPLARLLLPLADPARDRTRAGYDLVAPAYAAALPGLAAESPLELGMLHRTVARLPHGARLLDAGCGTGRLLAHLAAERPDLALTGLDLSPEMVRIASAAAPTAEVVPGDLTALPFADAAFDGLIAWYSLIHLAAVELPAAFAEFARVLAPGGVLLVGVQAGTGERRIPRAYGVDVDLLAHLHDLAGLEAAATSAGLVPRARAARRPLGREQHGQAFLIAEAARPATVAG